MRGHAVRDGYPVVPRADRRARPSGESAIPPPAPGSEGSGRARSRRNAPRFAAATWRRYWDAIGQRRVSHESPHLARGPPPCDQGCAGAHGGLHPSGREQVAGCGRFVEGRASRHLVHAFPLRHLAEPLTYPLAGSTVHDPGDPPAGVRVEVAWKRCGSWAVRRDSWALGGSGSASSPRSPADGSRSEHPLLRQR